MNIIPHKIEKNKDYLTSHADLLPVAKVIEEIGLEEKIDRAFKNARNLSRHLTKIQNLGKF